MKLKTIKLTALAAIAILSLNSCSDKKDLEIKVSKIEYELSFPESEAKADHAALIKTTLTTQNSLGEFSSKTYAEKIIKNYSTKGSLPVNIQPITITIKEELIFGVELTKDTYTLGLPYEFKIYSVTEDGSIIDTKSISNTTISVVEKDQIKNLYPETTTLSYTVDERGKLVEK